MPPISYREDDPSTFSSPLSHMDTTAPLETRMVFPHLTLLSAKIALYTTLAERDEGVYEKRLMAARDAVGILKKIQHYDANYHEVSMAVSTYYLAFFELGKTVCLMSTSLFPFFPSCM